MPRKRTQRNPRWKCMRESHLKTYPECRVCEDTADVVVHHLRYRGRRGHSEQPGDLVTMCRFHHDDFHGQWLGRRGTGVQATIDYITEKRHELAMDGSL